MAKHDLGDMEQIRSNLETWLRRTLPDADSLILGELRFPEASGESSVSLILEATNAGQTQRFICRMKPRHSEVFDDHDLLLQYQLMELAGANGVPVPPLLGYEADASLIDSDFYIMGFVEGQVPPDNPPYAFGSWVTELSDEERATQWRNGLATLARIHQIDLDGVDLSRLPRSAEDESPARHEIDKFKAMATPDVQARTPGVVLEALEYLDTNAPIGGPRRLCWGDARPGNVIWKDLKPTAVIDWEMASLADPLQEVGWWYWIDYVNCVGLGAPRPGGLPELDAIYRDWHAITGLPIDDAAFYDLFTVTRYAIILEKKFIAMEAAGIEGIGNFAVPFVAECLAKCRITE